MCINSLSGVVIVVGVYKRGLRMLCSLCSLLSGVLYDYLYVDTIEDGKYFDDLFYRYNCIGDVSLFYILFMYIRYKLMRKFDLEVD